MSRTRRSPGPGPWSPAVEHLRALDGRWAVRIERVGHCDLRPRRDRFATLVRAIIGQQISSKAAATIDARLRALGGTPHRPEALLDLGVDGLRSVGLSGVKAAYVLDLADRVAAGTLPLQRAGRWSDDEAIARLTEVKGIGRWTAEMFLIFALNRPDVLPVADLGIQVGLQRHFDLPERPKPAECHALTEAWRPHRTVAMWYLWRELDGPPAPPVHGSVDDDPLV